MEYKVVNSSSPEGLQSKVNKLIKEGFTPSGGVHVNVTHSQNRFRGQQHVDTINKLEYVQSVIKESE